MTERPADPACPTCGTVLVHVDSQISSGAFRTQAASMPQGNWGSGFCRIPSGRSLRTEPPGPYDCQVTVLDPAAGRAAFWRAAIVITAPTKTAIGVH
jgi:hypothetical protein